MRLELLVVSIFTCCSTITLAADTRFKMVVELDDGSILIGEPVTEEVRWKTKKGEQPISLKSAFSAELNEKQWTVETGQPKLGQLTGNLITPTIEMKTLFGQVTLPAKNLVKVEVYRIYDQIKLPHPEDLVLYMSFDQDLGKQARNLASFRHHGIVHQAKWIRSGRRGGAYEFTGSSWITIPHHKDLCPKAFTISAWLKPQDPAASWRLIISKTNSSTWHGGYGLYRNYGKDDNLYWYANNYYSTGHVVKDPVRREEWVHVACVFDGKSVIMYLNGEPTVKAAPPNGQGGVSHTDTPLMLGAGENGYYPWKGQMDEVMLFKRALTAAEVEEVMVLGLPDEGQ